MKKIICSWFHKKEIFINALDLMLTLNVTTNMGKKNVWKKKGGRMHLKYESRVCTLSIQTDFGMQITVLSMSSRSNEVIYQP